MPAIHSKLPILSLLQNHTAIHDSGSYPREREINRDVLLDVAPDREDLLKSKPIEEVRRALRLRVSSTYGNWLFRSQREVKIRDATTRFSTFNRSDDNKADELIEEKAQDIPEVATDNGPSLVARRRVSASSIQSPINPGGGLSRYHQPLSTQDRLISPRPVGPTHILIAYVASSQEENRNSRGRRTISKGSTPSFSDAIELPINDLLFLLNVPNLLPSGQGRFHPILPRRLHKEMPRVLMPVPHLETFPELVVYLHTKNQAALFRALIPQWMRDMMHPLPCWSAAAEAATTSTTASLTSFIKIGAGSKVKQLFRSVSASRSTSSVDSAGSSSSSVSEAHSSVYALGVEIAEVVDELGSSEDILVRTAASLEALRDNLNHIGFFNKELWTELDTCRSIIRQAVRHQSRVTADADIDSVE